MDRITLDQMYMKMAQILAKRSSCEKRKVGCLIVKNRQVVSEGYNGTPSGWDNQCEDEEGNTKPCVSHAESNAISKAASSSISCFGATMYCTLSPCFDCAKLIAQAHIDKVYYKEEYRKTDSLEYLLRNKIQIKQLDCDSTKH